jgi:spermidine synthase
MASAGFSTVRMHNQVLSMGEWGWILGSKRILDKEVFKKAAQQLDFSELTTTWLNTEAMQLMTSFGKSDLFLEDEKIRVNKIHDPVLYEYYLKGNWDLY